MKKQILILAVMALITTGATYAAEKTNKNKTVKAVKNEQSVKSDVKTTKTENTTVAALEIKEEPKSQFPIIVGTEKIMESDVAEELENIPQQYRSYYESEDGKKKIIDNLIQQKLIILDAKKNGVEKENEFTKELEKVKEKVLANYMVKKEIMDKVKISDEDLKAEYELKKDTFRTGESVKASHILLMVPKEAKQEEKDALKAKAQNILKDALAGKDFGELAKANSADGSAANGGDLGWFEKGAMVQPFEDAAFKGEKDKVYPEVVETQFGFHIIKVTDKKEAGLKSFEEVKNQLGEESLKNKQFASFNNWIENLKKQYMVPSVEKVEKK